MMTDPREGKPAAVAPQAEEQDQAPDVQAVQPEPRRRRPGGELGANEKYIGQVMEIERQAEEIYQQAVSEAERIPRLAEQEAQEIIETSRQNAQDEAHRITANNRAQEESAQILTQADEKVRRMKTLAASRIDMAVNFILDQIAGKE
jgi:vacuolar-type H+-ATPase subunit H